jgi:MFS transporter, PAT family, beta-lactamase induction signal transducer AmpG
MAVSPPPAAGAQRNKYILLASLYITQYLGLGFFFTALVAILRQQGVPLEQLSAIYVLGLFWILKFLWAPLIDRVSFGRLGHYRGWLIVMQSLLVLTLLIMGLFDLGTQLGLILGLCMLVGLLSATQDIAADALSCRLLAPDERGLGNGIQVGGGLLGNIIGGGLVLMLYPTIGWLGSMALLAAGTALPLVQLLRFREPTWSAAQHAGHTDHARFRDLLTFFGRPGMWRWLIVLLTYPLGVSRAYGLITPLLVDAGWSLERIGFGVNVVGSVLGLLAALGVGWMIRRLGRKPVMFGIALAMGFGTLLLLAPASGLTGDLPAWAAIGALFLLYSPSSAVLATVMMDNARPAAAGTDFTLQYCVFALVGFVAGGAGVALAGVFGYTTVIFGASAAAFLSALLVALLYTPAPTTTAATPLAVSPVFETAIPD